MEHPGDKFMNHNYSTSPYQLQRAKKYDKIRREGYTENIPLDDYDKDFIDKFEYYQIIKR